MADIYNGSKFQKPSRFVDYKTKYDMDSAELFELQKISLIPCYTIVLDLTTAQSPINPLVVNVQGQAFRIKGFTKATQYNYQSNSGIETVVNSVFVGCHIGFKEDGQPWSQENSIYLKHGSGYRGLFKSLAFFWPQQTADAARVEIYRYDGTPWMNGDYST